MMQYPKIVSLRVGKPRTHGTPGAEDPLERPWRSGFVKNPVSGPVELGWTNLAGDAQADLEHHGGVDKAVCVYPERRLAYWSDRLGHELTAGDFGENFTVSGQDETTVCIGDVYRVGQKALVQVTQPRSPCWKLARYHGEKRLALWVQQTGYGGWYLRVLQQGAVEAGQRLILVERPYPKWTVMHAHLARYGEDAGGRVAEELAGCPELGASWATALRRLVDGRASSDQSRRLIGPNQDGPMTPHED
ncbi:MAG: MOSC domain-containing protein [Persicimonas sp.]